MSIADHTVRLDERITRQLRAAISSEVAGGTLWERLIDSEDVPEKFLLDLLDAGLCIDELGHRSGPPALLERLAIEYEYPEAILTLVRQAFVDEREPVERFEQLLQRYGHHPWVLESLPRWPASSPAKRAVYLAVVDEPRFKRDGDIADLARQAQRISDPDEIARLFESGEPEVLRALADNPATPEAILRQLANHQGSRLARVIRSLAAANLHRRRHGSN